MVLVRYEVVVGVVGIVVLFAILTANAAAAAAFILRILCGGLFRLFHCRRHWFCYSCLLSPLFAAFAPATAAAAAAVTVGGTANDTDTVVPMILDQGLLLELTLLLLQMRYHCSDPVCSSSFYLWISPCYRCNSILINFQ